jgi:hydrogenase nickel incorporation protein HypB
VHGLRRDESGLSRFLRLGRDISARHAAGGKRRYCKRHGIFALNLCFSPGAAKTTRLCQSLARLPKELPVSVIEVDQQAPLDAERVRAAGVAADRIDTGKGCHLDAHQQRHAIDDPATADDASLLIEGIDLLPDVTFACQQAIAYVWRVNPQQQVIKILAISAAGMDEWVAWLQTGCAGQRPSKASTAITVDRHVAGIESSFSSHSRDTNV